MNEFSVIETYFKPLSTPQEDVLLGVGDDAACVCVQSGMDLCISTDTLVEGVHFLHSWDPFDIATRALLVNISDMAAMGATPRWVTIALTVPSTEKDWIARFAQGLDSILKAFQIALIGGDMTRGPCAVTVTIHGVLPHATAVKRSGADVGDVILVSGPLGEAAYLTARCETGDKLLRPTPRLDLGELLRQHASACIDISDGLTADLAHILQASRVGATLSLAAIPVFDAHQEKALEFALSGGDDYELCFTVKEASLPYFLTRNCYQIGVIEETLGLRAKQENGDIVALQPKGYSHF